MNPLSTTLNMSNTVFIFQTGVYAYEHKNFPAAREYFNTLVKRDPRHWEAKFYLAMSLIQTRERDQALIQLRKIVEECPDAAMRQRAVLAQLALDSMNH